MAALTDALIGDKPIKVEVNLSDSARNAVIGICITFFLLTIAVISTVKNKTEKP